MCLSSYLSIEFNSKYCVGVRVVADFSSLLEVTDFELPGGLEADDGHQAAGEQTLHDTHILCVRCLTQTHTYHQLSQLAELHAIL